MQLTQFEINMTLALVSMMGSILAAISAWLVNRAVTSIDSLQKQVTALNLEMKNYVPREEIETKYDKMMVKIEELIILFHSNIRVK